MNLVNDLTRFEKTRLVSARSFQLSLGAPPLVKADKGESMLDVAKKELFEKKIPLAVIRTFPSGETKKVEA
ncbi:DNA-directed RNA polymerase subunit omega [Candidatus Micrarchaeota archaeon]|nr:DNA-directed RNA polymerase subunit omega [Candidatus Micrarchaeota archaeon]MBU2476156.1 DNA-directed RNA polymerase subunit omega [Candidatus Micrarchaeota archaeon]